MNRIVFLKLGGSLITDKNTPFTARQDTIDRISAEIAGHLQAEPGLRLVIGHGSGSFGHVSGKKHQTRSGVYTPEQWAGFAEVWQAARQLNQMVVDSMAKAGVQVIAFPPSAGIITQDGRPTDWDLTAMQRAIAAGMVPLVNGDVAFDSVRGGTIVSTEDVFEYLASRLKPQQILLAGIEAGVWADYPACTRLVEHIRSQDGSHLQTHIGGSAAVDVTGGMAEKVQLMLRLVRQVPGLEALIFSGAQPGSIGRALRGQQTGTRLTA